MRGGGQGGGRGDEVSGLRGRTVVVGSWQQRGERKGRAVGGEQYRATDHARVEMWYPLVFLDRGAQPVGNARPELCIEGGAADGDLGTPGGMRGERIFEALESDEVAKEKVKRLQRSPQLERSGRRHSEGTVRTKRDQITQSRGESLGPPS